MAHLQSPVLDPDHKELDRQKSAPSILFRPLSLDHTVRFGISFRKVLVLIFHVSLVHS